MSKLSSRQETGDRVVCQGKGAVAQGLVRGACRPLGQGAGDAVS